MTAPKHVEGTTEWVSDEVAVTIRWSRSGSGPLILMLPAPSSISTPDEFDGLRRLLGDGFTTLAVDWPGSGAGAHARVAWTPDAYGRFLQFVLDAFGTAHATIAAGHGAAYVIAQAARQPGSCGRLVLLSPTWRGPLPTMTGKRLKLFDRIAAASGIPVLGAALYRTNVNLPVVGMMSRRHVYEDPAFLTDDWKIEKRRVMKAPNARQASIRFVTGALDRFNSRAEFLETAGRIRDPSMICFSRNAPRKSRGEMEALAALPNMKVTVLDRGKLSFYEEFPGKAFEAIGGFLVDGHISTPSPTVIGGLP